MSKRKKNRRLDKPRVPKPLRSAALHAKNVAASEGRSFNLTEWLADLEVLRKAKIEWRWVYMLKRLTSLKVVKNPERIRHITDHDWPTSTHDQALHKASLLAVGNPYNITANVLYHGRRKKLLIASKTWLENHGFELVA